MSTKKTPKAKAKKSSIPPPPAGWEIVSKDDPRLKDLPCKPRLFIPDSPKLGWHESGYDAGWKVDNYDLDNGLYALPIAQPAAEPAPPMIRLRLPSEKPTKEDADIEGFIIVFRDNNQFGCHKWSQPFSNSVTSWLPGRLPDGILPKPPTKEELWRKEFEEWWKSCDGISRNSFASTNEIAMAAFLAAKKSTK